MRPRKLPEGPGLRLAGPARAERWLAHGPARVPRALPPWFAALSLALHGLALVAALGLLALPRLTPPPPDQAVEMMWEQVPAEESMPLAEEAEPPSPPLPAEAAAPPNLAPPPQVAPPPALPPVAEAPPPPPPLLAEAPPAQPDSTALLPPPPPPLEEPAPPVPPPQATVAAEPPPEPEEALPLPPPSPPPPPRQQAQPAPRPPAPQQQAEAHRKAVDGAENLPPVSRAEGSARVTGPTSPAAPDYRPPQPAFPEGARMRGETGTVRVRLTVDAAGQVARVEILQSSGFRELDRATEEYYRRWRFRPALRDGQPVAEQVTTAMTWRLNGFAASRSSW